MGGAHNFTYQLLPLFSMVKGDAGQKAPPGGNSRHTTYETPQKVVAAFLSLVLYSFPPF